MPKPAEEPQMTAKRSFDVETTQGEGETRPNSNVRRSIGEWEAGKSDTSQINTTPPRKTTTVEAQKPKPKTTVLPKDARVGARRASVEAAGSPPKQERIKYKDRLSEAKACLTKAKLNLGNSRNIKTEIKAEVIQAVERLYQLVKEVESIKGEGKTKYQEPEKEREPEKEKTKEDSELILRMEEYGKLIQANNDKMEKLKETLERQQEIQERTYANVTAESVRRHPPQQTALHSVVVTAKDDTETGEEILNRIRKVVNAKEGGIEIEKIRKAKDRKVIVGCKSEQEREKVKQRLKTAEEHLNVEEMRNKDPLVILRDVLKCNSDEDVLNALRNQNENIRKERDQKMEIAYKKRARNPHTHHIVLRVSPKIWQRITEAGSVLIDLQRVRAADQSPLVQCSLCLGYGHGRRFCKETLEKCSHCGGPHMKTECADWIAGTVPSCCNCMHAKMDKTDHNAFSQECTVRRKWEALARATIAYC